MLTYSSSVMHMNSRQLLQCSPLEVSFYLFFFTVFLALASIVSMVVDDGCTRSFKVMLMDSGKQMRV